MVSEGSTEFLTVLLPVFNNESQLVELVTRTDQQFAVAGLDGEILLIDDGSEPSVWSLILQLTTTTARARGVRLSRNFGQHAAIRAGLELGRGTLFILMDADLENRPEDIPRLVDAMRSSDNQIVIAKWANAPKRRLFSRTFHRLVAAGRYDADQLVDAATFRIFTRRIRDELLRYREQGVVFGPVMHQLGFGIDFVEVNRDLAKAPRSRYNLLRRIRLAKPFLTTILVGAAIRLFAIIGIVGVLFAAIVSGIVMLRFISAGGSLVSTNAIYGIIVVALIGFIAIGLSALLFVSNAILAEVRSRPTFHIAESTVMGLPREIDE